MIELGVNIDHVATVRQARRTYEPDPVWAAVEAHLGGADGITVHLREDRRHIQDEDVRRLKTEIAAQKGSTYFARVQYGRLVDGALQSRSEQYVSEIFEALRDVSVASRINKPIGDKMIMNAAFLIARDHETAFDAKVKSIASRFDKLTFKYTGPWPPYNFVNIRLKLERA